MSRLLDEIVENIHISCTTFGVPIGIPHTRLVTGNTDVFYKRLIYSDWFYENLAVTHIGTIFRINPLVTHKYEDGTVRIADELQLSPDPVSPLDFISIPGYVCAIPSFAPSTNYGIRLIPLMLRYFFGRIFINNLYEDHVVNNANRVSFSEMINLTKKIDSSPGEYFNDGVY